MNSRKFKYKRRNMTKRQRQSQRQYAGTPPRSFFNNSGFSPRKTAATSLTAKSRKVPYSKRRTLTKREMRLHKRDLEALVKDDAAKKYELETHYIRSQNANQARSKGPHGFGLLKHMSQNTRPRIGIVRDDKTGLAKFKRDKDGNLMWYALDDVYYEHPVAPPAGM